MQANTHLELHHWPITPQPMMKHHISPLYGLSYGLSLFSSMWSFAIGTQLYRHVVHRCIFHPHCNLPWCSTHCWSWPWSDSTWFFTFAGLVEYFSWNLGEGLWSSLNSVSGKTSSKNSSATSPSSSILRRFACHLKPCPHNIQFKIHTSEETICSSPNFCKLSISNAIIHSTT